MILPVILCGGVGSRLWPLSREAFPKQFSTFLGKNSLLQETALRIKPLSQKPLIICGHEHRFIAAEQMQTIGIEPEAILLEPVVRNTAPAIAIAALYAIKKYHEAILLILPADHSISNDLLFIENINKALDFVKQDHLLLFGSPTRHPHTGYSYIRAGEFIHSQIRRILQFVENPDLTEAMQFVSDGNYYWNSGILMAQAQILAEEFKLYAPKVWQFCDTAYQQIKKDFDFYRLPENIYQQVPADSIDSAILEKTKKSLIMPIDVNWSDLATWSAIHDHQTKDEQGNLIVGDVECLDVKNCYLRSSHRLLAVIGLKDLIAIETADAVLIAAKSASDNLKPFVEQMKLSQRDEIKWHSRVQRPWGFYETLKKAARFRVKRICVKPGANLTLQKHLHRSEHWVVIDGQAQIVCDGHTFYLDCEKSTYTPSPSLHQLSNISERPLEIIEIQVGDYLGNDENFRYTNESIQIETKETPCETV